MILKALEMDLVLGHKALGSLPSAELLPPSSATRTLEESVRRTFVLKAIRLYF